MRDELNCSRAILFRANDVGLCGQCITITEVGEGTSAAGVRRRQYVLLRRRSGSDEGAAGGTGGRSADECLHARHITRVSHHNLAFMPMKSYFT